MKTISTIDKPQSGVGDKSAQIAAGIIIAPDAPSVMLAKTILNALASGIRRESVPVLGEYFIFNSALTTCVVSVPWPMRGEAVKAVKQALAELGLLDIASVAMETAEVPFLTVHGFGLGGIKFEEAFIRAEDCKSTVAALQAHMAARTVLFQKILTEAKAHVASQASQPPPDAGPEGAAA